MSSMNGTLEIHGDKRCVTCVCDLHYGMQYMCANASIWSVGNTAYVLFLKGCVFILFISSLETSMLCGG